MSISNWLLPQRQPSLSNFTAHTNPSLFCSLKIISCYCERYQLSLPNRRPHAPLTPLYKYPPLPSPKYLTQKEEKAKRSNLSHNFKKKNKFSQLSLEMAQVSILKAFLVALVMAFLTAASAQVSEAPSPTPDAGAGFSVGVSSAAVAFSLIVSLLTFLKH